MMTNRQLIREIRLTLSFFCIQHKVQSVSPGPWCKIKQQEPKVTRSFSANATNDTGKLCRIVRQDLGLLLLTQNVIEVMTGTTCTLQTYVQK